MEDISVQEFIIIENLFLRNWYMQLQLVKKTILYLEHTVNAIWDLNKDRWDFNGNMEP